MKTRGVLKVARRLPGGLCKRAYGSTSARPKSGELLAMETCCARTSVHCGVEVAHPGPRHVPRPGSARHDSAITTFSVFCCDSEQ